MSKIYKIIHAASEHDSHAFEEFESKINYAAKDGYRLELESLKVFREERGDNLMPLCRLVAVMTKKTEKNKEKIAD